MREYLSDAARLRVNTPSTTTQSPLNKIAARDGSPTGTSDRPATRPPSPSADSPRTLAAAGESSTRPATGSRPAVDRRDTTPRVSKKSRPSRSRSVKLPAAATFSPVYRTRERTSKRAPPKRAEGEWQRLKPKKTKGKTAVLSREDDDDDLYL
jgi:hypothetical protein